MRRFCLHAECQSEVAVLFPDYQTLMMDRESFDLEGVYENEILPSRFWDNPACAANGFCGAVTPTRSLRHSFDMKKILILTSIILASATTGMFADDAAPMPSVNIPASPAPATQTAPAQTPGATHAKGKHKGRKHRKHTKKTETKKTESNTATASGSAAGTK
jgi:hypothetical protein